MFLSCINVSLPPSLSPFPPLSLKLISMSSGEDVNKRETVSLAPNHPEYWEPKFEPRSVLA